MSSQNWYRPHNWHNCSDRWLTAVLKWDEKYNYWPCCPALKIESWVWLYTTNCKFELVAVATVTLTLYEGQVLVQIFSGIIPTEQINKLYNSPVDYFFHKGTPNFVNIRPCLHNSSMDYYCLYYFLANYRKIDGIFLLAASARSPFCAEYRSWCTNAFAKDYHN